MKVSVIIVTRNRREDLRDTILSYLAQTHPNKEIIIVDNGSDDGTREMMQSDFPDIDYTWLPENFDIRSLNIAVARSKGDILWRTDDDSYPEDPNAFSRVCEIFEKNPNIDILCSEDIEVRDNYKIWEWYPLEVDKTNIPSDGFKSNIFPGTGAGIRRRVFDKIGGFWEFGFEELDFCTRAIMAGFSIRYFPDIRTLHFASRNNRIADDRWVKINKQLLRYQWKYMPFFKALGRSMVFLMTATIEAIYKKIRPAAYFEGIFGMISVSFMAYRNERMVVPKHLMYDVTLGKSAFRSQFLFYKSVISRKLFKKK
ncbi:MAG: glycosyltransferase [Candidatus Kapabacteria bacterium]|nr:glycosyltransferase [Ignavibacteriota bacterium]MCW5885229.1 glycosyltransferase [Candidatus Kapabacteria bacterium]